MKRYFAKLPRLLVVAAVITILMVATAVPAFAANTDEILNFTITVDVNEDASLEMTYHIDWKVLDDSIGELEWINLGVPNSHHENIKARAWTRDGHQHSVQPLRQGNERQKDS